MSLVRKDRRVRRWKGEVTSRAVGEQWFGFIESDEHPLIACPTTPAHPGAPTLGAAGGTNASEHADFLHLAELWTGHLFPSHMHLSHRPAPKSPRTVATVSTASPMRQ